MAPLEIVSRFEAPFRAAGLNPGLVTTSSLAALELAPEGGLTMIAKLTGRSLSAAGAGQEPSLKLVRCLELPSSELEDITAVLVPTFVYMEDNLGGRAEKLLLCGFGARDGRSRAAVSPQELAVEVERAALAAGSAGRTQRGSAGLSALRRQEQLI